ncbi:Pentatricopeptide repeat-containing protein [Glycine max]|nr:Pentatricopeptide repeat-containing protein [Glycine max]
MRRRSPNAKTHTFLLNTATMAAMAAKKKKTGGEEEDKNEEAQLQAYLTTLAHAHAHFYAFKLIRFCAISLSNITTHASSSTTFLLSTLTSSPPTPPTPPLSPSSATCSTPNPPRPNHFIFPQALKTCLASRTAEFLHAQIVKSEFHYFPLVQAALVDSYSKVSDGLGNAKKVFDEMSERNVVSFTAIVSRFKRVGGAMRVFGEMLERDVPSWNTLVAGCTQNGAFTRIKLFRRMVCECNRPNGVTVACALSACGHTGMLQLGRWIHGYMYKNGFAFDSFVSNALVDIFVLHGQSDSAIAIFEQMVEGGDGMGPDEVTFIGLLNAWTLDEAINAVKGMSMEPIEVVWASFLNRCKVPGRTNLAEFAAKKLIEIDPHNRGYRIMLADVYGELGKWDEVRNVWRTLKQQKSYKVPGCSCIVDDQVHQFYSLDKSNLKTKRLVHCLRKSSWF